MDTTDVLSNYFMTVDMHRFALMWLVYSRNIFFRVGPTISEKFVPGGTNFRGVQIKRDKASVPLGVEKNHSLTTATRHLSTCAMHTSQLDFVLF